MKRRMTCNLESEQEESAIRRLLAEARKDERRGRAEMFAAHLERLAAHILRDRLDGPAAASLLQESAISIQHQAQEIY